MSRAGAAALVAGLVAGVCVLTGPVASAQPPSAQPPSAQRAAPSPWRAARSVVDRTIKDGRITESSGLAPSLLHRGVLWTHNDSGNSARIYAIGANGATRAALTLRSEPNVDWEAMATLRTRTGIPLIAVADIGDNEARHPSVRIALVREPRRLGTASVTPSRVLRLTYPGGPRDAEALLADPRDGRLYVVSKTLFGSDLYAVPPSLWPGRAGSSGRVSAVTRMTKVASMGAGLVTDGAFLPDGRFVLRGYGRMWVMDRPESVRKGRIATLADASLPAQDQGESIAVTSGGRQVLIGSEGRREDVLRLPVPAAPGDRGDSGPASLPPDPTGAQAVPRTAGLATGTAPVGPAFSGGGNLRVWTALVGGGIVLLVLSSAGVLFWTRNDR